MWPATWSLNWQVDDLLLNEFGCADGGLDCGAAVRAEEQRKNKNNNKNRWVENKRDELIYMSKL